MEKIYSGEDMMAYYNNCGEKEDDIERICIICGEIFIPKYELFECEDNICSSCYQEIIRDNVGYEGDLL
jgi:formylmethanofuran dehydrogenase subunit E